MNTSRHINNTTPNTSDDYTKIFNILAVFTVIGILFIFGSIPALAEPVEAEPVNITATKKFEFPNLNNLSIPTPDASYAFEIEANRAAAEAAIDVVSTIRDYMDGIEPQVSSYEYVGEFYITCYAATVEQCGNDLGITASGRPCTTDPTCWTVAVDPKIIPLGTYLVIDGYPGIVFRADDTGSAINNYDIDIYSDSEQESKQFNNQSNVKVWIIKDLGE